MLILVTCDIYNSTIKERNIKEKIQKSKSLFRRDRFLIASEIVQIPVKGAPVA